MLSLVESLKADDIPLDGIGFQGHLLVGEVPTSIQSQMEAFTALGVEVAITELDIRMTLPATAALYEQQKTDYQTVIAACQAVEQCVGVTIWDYTVSTEMLTRDDGYFLIYFPADRTSILGYHRRFLDKALPALGML